MSEIDFGELKNDTNLVSRVENVQKALKDIENHVDKMLEIKYDDLTNEDKIEYDIFMLYAINALYFMHIKINGDNSQINDVKHELSRVKKVMERQKEIEDRKLRPEIHKDAVKRLIRGGLYDVQQKNKEFKQKREQQQNQHKIYIGDNPNPLNRKRKFDND